MGRVASFSLNGPQIEVLRMLCKTWLYLECPSCNKAAFITLESLRIGKLVDVIGRHDYCMHCGDFRFRYRLTIKGSRIAQDLLSVPML